MFDNRFLKFYAQHITKFSIAYILLLALYSMVPPRFLSVFVSGVFIAFIFLNSIYYYFKKRYIELILFFGAGLAIMFYIYR